MENECPCQLRVKSDDFKTGIYCGPHFFTASHKQLDPGHRQTLIDIKAPLSPRYYAIEKRHVNVFRF